LLKTLNVEDGHDGAFRRADLSWIPAALKAARTES
jgi:hypothetical protein